MQSKMTMNQAQHINMSPSHMKYGRADTEPAGMWRKPQPEQPAESGITEG